MRVRPGAGLSEQPGRESGGGGLGLGSGGVEGAGHGLDAAGLGGEGGLQWQGWDRYRHIFQKAIMTAITSIRQAMQFQVGAKKLCGQGFFRLEHTNTIRAACKTPTHKSENASVVAEEDKR